MKHPLNFHITTFEPRIVSMFELAIQSNSNTCVFGVRFRSPPNTSYAKVGVQIIAMLHQHTSTLMSKQENMS